MAPPERSASPDRPGDVAAFTPIAVTTIELTEPMPDASEFGSARQLRALVRLNGEPIEMIDVRLRGQDGSAAAIAAQIWAALKPRISQRFLDAGHDAPTSLPVDGVRLPALDVDRHRERLLSLAEPFTVVVATRGRPELLSRCLDHLATLEYPDVHVVVVDNTAGDERTESVVRSPRPGLSADYVREPVPGLARARNRGLAVAETPFVAFADDDEVVDPRWLIELLRGFHRTDDVDAVTGAILPMELETQEQLWFEDYGGHNKGRSFAAEVFDSSTRRQQSPLMPVPPFGAGGNMAFRRSSLVGLGGFDEALGAGTRAQGAEDTEVLSRLLLDGGRIVRQPSAIVWHPHYRDRDGLERQFAGYGRGITAFYCALLMRRPWLIAEMALLAPRAVRAARGGAGSVEGPGQAFPADLVRIKRRAMLQGPWAYLRGRWEARAREVVA